MSHAVWKGSINFGLVSVPVKLSSATEDKDVQFHQAHVHEDGTHGRIKIKRTCSVCEREVQFQDIAKSHETETGTVILTKEDIAAVKVDAMHTIEVQEFVPASEVPFISAERHYTVTPEAVGVRAYSLLMTALQDSGRVGIVKVALRQREQLAMLHVRDGRLALTTLRWADEIREMPEADYPPPSKAELSMAMLLIDSLSVPTFHPNACKDEYRAALMQRIEEKRKGLAPAPVPKVETAPAMELIAALTASVERNSRVCKPKAPARKPRARKAVAA